MVRTKLLIGPQFMLLCVFFVFHSMSQMSRIQMINKPRNKFVVLNFNKMLINNFNQGLKKSNFLKSLKKKKKTLGNSTQWKCNANPNYKCNVMYLLVT